MRLGRSLDCVARTFVACRLAWKRCGMLRWRSWGRAIRCHTRAVWKPRRDGLQKPSKPEAKRERVAELLGRAGYSSAGSGELVGAVDAWRQDRLVPMASVRALGAAVIAQLDRLTRQICRPIFREELRPIPRANKNPPNNLPYSRCSYSQCIHSLRSLPSNIKTEQQTPVHSLRVLGRGRNQQDRRKYLHREWNNGLGNSPRVSASLRGWNCSTEPWAEMEKGCDIGYALATSSREGANNVEHAPSQPFDAITAFAVPNPN